MNAAELKEKLSKEDIKDFVVNCLKQEEPLEDSQGNLLFVTFCHGGDSHKLYYYDDSRLFHCYTSSCGTFDIYDLIQKAGFANDFIGAYQLLCSYFGTDPFGNQVDLEPQPELTSDWDLLVKIDALNKEKKRKQQKTNTLSENLLEFYSPCVPALWADQGISPEAMRKFGVRMDIGGERIIIPHRDLNGNLIGIRCRNCNKEELDNGSAKYMPVFIEQTCYNHPLGDHLYGLYENKETIQKLKKVVVYEAEKSVQLTETYYPNNNYSVAVCGSVLSDTQVNLLLSLGVEEIIIAFDKEGNDFASSEQTMDYQEKIESLTAKFAPYVKTYYVMDYWNKLGPKDSPADLGRETLEFLLKKKIFVPSVVTQSKVVKKNGK